MSPASDPTDPAARAREISVALGPPTSALEDWRYVRCDALLESPAKPETAFAIPQQISAAQAALPAGAIGLVLVDGRIRSASGFPPEWQLVAPDRAHDGAWVKALTPGTPTAQDHALVWSLVDGARQVIRVSGHHGQPLRLVNLVTGGVSGWRLRIELAPGAELEVVVEHRFLAPARSCPGLDLVLGRNAHLRVSEVTAAGTSVLLTSHTMDQGQDSSVRWVTATAGGRCVRFSTQTVLSGAGASADLAAISVARHTDQAHILTRVIHRVGHTSSTQLIKAILHDQANASFDGLVKIAVGAVGSSAKQQNRNLLLSPKARADTRPQLDIKADDVQAAHGATIGQLDAEELLYLQLRGLSLAQASGLLTAGFVDEVVERMPDGPTRILALQQVQGR